MIDFSAAELVHNFSYSGGGTAINKKPSQVVADLGGGDLLVRIDGSLRRLSSTLGIGPNGNSAATHPTTSSWHPGIGSILNFQGADGRRVGAWTGTHYLAHWTFSSSYSEVYRIGTAGYTMFTSATHGDFEQWNNLGASLFVGTHGFERFDVYNSAATRTIYNHQADVDWDHATIPYGIYAMTEDDGLWYAHAFDGIWVADPTTATAGANGQILLFTPLHLFSSAGDGGFPYAIAAAGDRIYFVNDDWNNQIRSIPKSGGTPTVEWTNPNAGYTLRSLAVVGDYLYLAAEDDFLIWRFPISVPATGGLKVGMLQLG